MKILYSLLFISFLTVNVFSQSPSGRQVSGNIQADASVTGKVIDSNTGQPVEYASIGLYRMKDSSLVSGVVSDANGNFAITSLNLGRFYVDVSFMGYKKSRITGIMLSPNQKSAALGSVKLEPSVTEIKAVEVVGERSQMEYKIDKKVINVSQQVVASGGTAIDVLENTPSVQTDIEGNVQLRGSSNFTVLIDGKPTPLQGSEALQQIPASAIQNIEIITNPSAKYDPDGTAGIINVLMKKQKVKGMNGIINLSTGTGFKSDLLDKYNGDFLINYKTSKFNYFLGGDFNDMQFTMNGSSNERTWSGTLDTIIQNETIEGKMKRSGKGIKAGFDYYINDRNTITVSGNYSERAFGRNFLTKHHEYQMAQDSNIYYLYNSNMRGPHKDISANLDYRLIFDKSDHQLLATLYYETDRSGHPTDMTYTYTDDFWNHTLFTIRQRAEEDENENEYRVKLDYTRPVDKGKMEIGYQGRHETAQSDYYFYNITQISDRDSSIEDKSRHKSIDFAEHIEAAYATFSQSMKLFDYQVGFRAEYTDRNTKSNISNEEHPVRRFDFFPSIHLSKQLPWELQIQASYSRRINRPRGWDLDPFVRYMDQKTVRKGNPDLEPELTDSYELNLQKKIGESLFSIEGYFRQTNDLISEIKSYNIHDSITTYTVDNFKRAYSLGGEVTLDIPVAKWWNFNATSSVFQYHIDANADYATKSQNTVSMTARINSTFRLKSGTQIQANYFYNAPSVTPQGKRDAFSFTTLGVRQDLFKRKASFTLQVRDLFGTMKFNTITESAGLYSYDRRKRESPVVMLTLTYRINNFKQQARRDRDSEGVNETEFGGGMD